MKNQAILARSRLRALVLYAIMASVLYGASYQQFNMFTINSPGLSDSKSYLAMSHGNYNVYPIHRYRIVIPSLAALVQKALHSNVEDSERRDKLSFFIVNFVFSLATGILLHGIFGRMGFNWEMSLLGTIFFLTSRINIISVGAPLVDSLYFFAVALIVYLTLYERVGLLVLLLPLMILSKETILPFLFLPFAKADMRNWKMMVSVGVALAVLYVFRQNLVPADVIGESPSLGNIISEHLPHIDGSLRSLGTLKGIHDLLNGFALLALIAVAGLLLDRRSATPRIPGFLLLIIPIAFVLAIVSGNLGRMFFAAYVPILSCALIAIEHFCKTAMAGDLLGLIGGERCLTSDISGLLSSGGQSRRAPA